MKEFYTWNDLAEFIGTLSNKQRETSVTVYDETQDEFFGVFHMAIAEDNGIPDPVHPYVAFNEKQE